MKEAAAHVARQVLTGTAAGRVALLAPRLWLGLRAAGLGQRVGDVLAWCVQSKELSNWTYDTTPENQVALCFLVASLCDVPATRVLAYHRELFADAVLHERIVQVAGRRGLRWQVDGAFKPGRRIAYYLLVRCLRPRRVVEAGLDKGLGGLLLTRALQRNAQEGHAGRYTGIEYDPARAVPYLEEPFHADCSVVRGDSLAWLRGAEEPIDLFIHDTTPASPHLPEQLEAVRSRMPLGGVLLSVWTNQAVFDFAAQPGMQLLTHKDATVRHPHPGAQLAFLRVPGRSAQ